MSRRWRSADIPLTGSGSIKPVSIVADGAIATTALGDGRLIPILILDTAERPDIEDLVRALDRLPPGDVKSHWARRKRTKGKICLVLRFERPSEVLVILEFDVFEQGILVESILTAKTVFLQPGRKGDRLSTTLDHPRIWVEVPELGFREEWDKLWLIAIATKLKSLGLKRRDAKKGASTVISEMREVAGIRMRQR